eukprot:9939-Heterococcus_DN1.PRE.3
MASREREEERVANGHSTDLRCFDLDSRWGMSASVEATLLLLVAALAPIALWMEAVARHSTPARVQAEKAILYLQLRCLFLATVLCNSVAAASLCITDVQQLKNGSIILKTRYRYQLVRQVCGTGASPCLFEVMAKFMAGVDTDRLVQMLREWVASAEGVRLLPVEKRTNTVNTFISRLDTSLINYRQAPTAAHAATMRKAVRSMLGVAVGTRYHNGTRYLCRRLVEPVVNDTEQTVEGLKADAQLNAAQSILQADSSDRLERLNAQVVVRQQRLDAVQSAEKASRERVQCTICCDRYLNAELPVCHHMYCSMCGDRQVTAQHCFMCQSQVLLYHPVQLLTHTAEQVAAAAAAAAAAE